MRGFFQHFWLTYSGKEFKKCQKFWAVCDLKENLPTFSVFNHTEGLGLGVQYDSIVHDSIITDGLIDRLGNDRGFFFNQSDFSSSGKVKFSRLQFVKSLG